MKRWALAALAVLALGCGDDDDDATRDGGDDGGVTDPDGGDGGGADPDLVQYATVLCQRLEQCAPTILQMMSGGDVDACVAREVETMAPALALEGLRLDARACSGMFGGLPCGQILRIANLQMPPPSGCYIPGTLPDGASCTYPLQCQSFVCDRPEGTSCGVCASPLALGADCSERTDLLGSPCGPGRTCAAGVCVPLGELGQACDVTTTPCAVDLGCVAGVCAPPAQEGEACTEVVGECDLWGAGLVCNPMTSECIAGTFAAVGEECGIAGEAPVACAASDCLPDPLAGTCTARAADGEPCDDEEGPLCEVHAQCVDGACEQYFVPVCD